MTYLGVEDFGYETFPVHVLDIQKMGGGILGRGCWFDRHGIWQDFGDLSRAVFYRLRDQLRTRSPKEVFVVFGQSQGVTPGIPLDLNNLVGRCNYIITATRFFLVNEGDSFRKREMYVETKPVIIGSGRESIGFSVIGRKLARKLIVSCVAA